MPKIFHQSIACNADSLDVKKLMNNAVGEAKRLYGLEKKQIAAGLGIPDAVLSRWLGTNDGHTIWLHLVHDFCRMTKNNDLINYMRRTKRRIA